MYGLRDHVRGPEKSEAIARPEKYHAAGARTAGGGNLPPPYPSNSLCRALVGGTQAQARMAGAAFARTHYGVLFFQKLIMRPHAGRQKCK